MIVECFERSDLSTRAMTALLMPLANCAELLVHEKVEAMLQPCIEKTFKHVEKMDESGLKGKETAAISDLMTSAKILCMHMWPEHAEECDSMRLDIIYRMLKIPHFSCKMNALKEVSRLIEESERKRFTSNAVINGDQLVDWMEEKKVLSTALEGNIDQLQYTDRIKIIVEFLGVRLSTEDLDKIWSLQDSANLHVVDNVYGILAGAVAKFSLAQIEHLTQLTDQTWQKVNDSTKDKLLNMIGRVGREATQFKASQAVLQLLWKLAHQEGLSRPLLEKALAEHLEILSQLTINKDGVRKTYLLKCVEDIKAGSDTVLSSISHLHNICKSCSSYHKAEKTTLQELNKQHEIVRGLCVSLRRCHEQAFGAAAAKGARLSADTRVHCGRYAYADAVEMHLELIKFLLKEGDLYLSWSRCQELWATLGANANATPSDKQKLFRWFEECLNDLEAETQDQFFKEMLLNIAPDAVTEQSFQCFRSYFESINVANNAMKRGLSSFVSDWFFLPNSLTVPLFAPLLPDRGELGSARRRLALEDRFRLS
jgi:ubiquitin carboxyl-terminal hydrolase 9/24